MKLTKRESEVSLWQTSREKVYLTFQKQPLDVLHKKAVFKNFVIFAGKHLCWSVFRLETLLKGDSNTGIKSIAKFLRTSILKNIISNGYVWTLRILD